MATDRQDRRLALISRIDTEVDVRNREALKVYRPMHLTAEYVHRSRASELLTWGGKRAGKTLATVCEFGSRVLGEPIIGMDGQPIPLRWPVSTTTNPRLYWLIGWSIDHIGQSLYSYLFLPAGGGTHLRVIRDLETSEWRAWNQANPSDQERLIDSQPAGAVIPERLIKRFHFKEKGARHFTEAELVNGAILRAYPSSARNPKMGDKVSGLWIDEDIQIASHLEEWQDRLTDSAGWFLWSVWPKTSNTALKDLMMRAEEQVGLDNPQIEAVQFVMTDNAYITEQGKELALGRMNTEEARKRRNEGLMLLDHLSMYDFVAPIHGIVAREETDREELLRTMIPNRHSILRTIYTLNQQSFPADWTRYLAIDPSHTRTAVLFGVVAPPEVKVGDCSFQIGDCLVVEQELIVEKCDAQKLANAIKRAITGRTYHAFIMDRRMGVQTQAGADMNVFQRYSEAFARAQLESIVTKNGFIPGCDKPRRRYEDVRNLLSGDGWPHLFICVNRCPKTCREFDSYQKKQQIIGGVETIFDEPANPRKHDCMAALEYLSSYIADAFRTRTAYQLPRETSHRSSQVYRFAQQILKEQGLQGRRDDSYVHLGPGAAA